MTLLVLAVLAGGGYALFGRKTSTPPNAGAQITSNITPSVPSHSPPATVGTAQAHTIQLEQALTTQVTWGQLAPFLKNIANQGVSTTCLNVTATNEAACRFGAKPASHHAVIIGDAAALDWMPAIVAELAPHGWDVQVLTEARCPVSVVAITINNVVNTACAAHHSFVASQIATLKPSLIFASDEEIDLAYATAPPKPKGLPRQKPEDSYKAGLASAVESFAKVGKVVVIGSAPGGKRVTDCEAGTGSPKGCVASVRSSWQAYQTLVRTVVAGHADYLDPTTFFCHLGKCPAVVGVVPQYIDGVRMSAAYSKSLAFVFAPYIGK